MPGKHIVSTNPATGQQATAHPLLYLNRADIIKLGGSTSDLYIEALQQAFLRHARGEVVQPLKPYLRAQQDSGHIADRIIAMPAYIGGEEAIAGIKWVGSKHDNPARYGWERASALIILNDPDTNYPLAVMEGGLISSMRTAALTALAARYLARVNFRTFSCIGCGLIARTHLRVFLEQFPGLAMITLFDLERSTLDSCLAEFRSSFPLIEFHAATSAEEAVGKGEVVVTCTVAAQPYLSFAWLQKGSFFSNVSLMDAHRDVFLQADKVIVDDWEQCNREKKMLHQLVQEGHFSRAQLHAELSEIISGQRPGRETEEEIILLNPIGLALEDVACAQSIYRRALAAQTGTWLHLYE
ncbi:MAG TPA: 2,3-diaminopropionate biosynthesis protein SbnB [Ktedonobacteraceae bacterium]